MAEFTAEDLLGLFARLPAGVSVHFNDGFWTVNDSGIGSTGRSLDALRKALQEWTVPTAEEALAIVDGCVQTSGMTLLRRFVEAHKEQPDG